MAQKKAFLGVGWKFPIDVDRRRGVAMSQYEDNIYESIIIILGTAPGERVMRPHFGCEIHDLLFAPNDMNTAGLAAHYCVKSLTKWEPRIEDIEAHAAPSNDFPNKLLINIQYKVRATNNTHNLVYPFYLRRSEEQ